MPKTHGQDKWPCQKHMGKRHGHAKNAWSHGMHVNFNKRQEKTSFEERTVLGAVSGDLGQFWENSQSF